MDLTKKAAELKATASSILPTVLKVAGVGVASAALVFGAFAGWDWARVSPRFSIEKLHFTGNQRATDDELARLGGLKVGQNLLALDLPAAERLIAAHPWVKQIHARRTFSRTLELQIVEHQPVAMVSLGELYLLDDAGEPFKKVVPSDAVDLPLVTGIERDDYVARHDETVHRLLSALEVAQAYSASSVGRASRLSEVHLEEDGVTLVTNEGQQVHLGEGNWGEKLNRLARVRQELKARSLSAEVVRLDNRARPTWITVSLASVASPERGGRTGK